MAKKDILERLNQAPGDGTPRRVESTDPRSTEGLVETRVSRKVVRRRKADDEPDEPAVTTTTVRRRRAVDEKPAPVAEPTPVEAPKAAEPVKAAEVAEAKPVEAPKAVEAAPAPPVEAPKAPEPAPPVVEEPAPKPVVAPAPEVQAEPVAAAPAAAPEAPQGGEEQGLPEQPRFQGLGKAVVMPPPGYDPTNPTTWRRESVRPAPRSAAPAPAAPKAEEAPRGRRRVASPDFRDRRGGPPSRRPGPGGGRGGRFDANQGRRKKRGGMSPPKQPSPTPKAIKRKIRVDNVISVSQLAHEMGVKASAVIKELLGMGQMATANEMLDIDTATLVASEFEYQVENVGFQEDEFIPQVEDGEEEEGLIPRPPVVTIMGHVDHGKTTLLDAIRDARVAQGEAGGITQHIGAYQVEHNGRLVTFIDTPGHAAFTEMRARGAQVTDIVVLVVAADDGVQPQTEEAIAHAKAAGVPIVVAINKVDKPGVNADNIKTRLSEHGLQPEEWGGETLYAPVSALKRTGIDGLLEQILLQSEVLELSANPDRFAEGIVIESKMERGRGAVATVLVQKGTLKRGDFVVLGAVSGKVRAMVDHKGKPIKLALPSMPVEIFGLSDLPETGDVLTVVENEKNARTLAEHRAAQRRQEEMARQRRKTADDLFALARGEDKKTLNIVLKADVHGSLEALRAAIEAIDVPGAEVRILHAGVGAISESDVNLAVANDTLLIGFNVNVGPNARAAASGQGVEPEMFEIIYGVLDRVKALLTGMLEPEYELVRRGMAEVRAIFKISRIGTVAGCYVLDGPIARGHTAKLLREGKEIWTGKITTLKRFKDDVREVGTGYECGISLDGMDDIRENDLIETYSLEEIVRT